MTKCLATQRLFRIRWQEQTGVGDIVERTEIVLATSPQWARQLWHKPGAESLIAGPYIWRIPNSRVEAIRHLHVRRNITDVVVRRGQIAAAAAVPIVANRSAVISAAIVVAMLVGGMAIGLVAIIAK